MIAEAVARALDNYLRSHTSLQWQGNYLTPPCKAAVMLALFPQNGSWYLPFIVRNHYQGVHSGQVAFPGGKCDLQDADAIDTAIRETYEETGLLVNRSQVVGQLHEVYIPPSNSLVVPVVAVLAHAPHFVPNPKEVAEIFWLSVSYLRRRDIRGSKEVTLPDGRKVPYTTFQANGKEIWGATARMLSELLTVLERVL